ncbi:MAG: DUF4197 domain-containing protein [Chitinophagales bacterium]
MTKRFILILICFPLLFGGCESANRILQSAGDILTGESGIPTDLEVGNGLKEALEFGIVNGADMLSQEDGYFGNSLVKIMFPPEAQKVEQALRNLGMDEMVDKTLMSFNRAAELAAKEAGPIFKTAIKEMTFSDAMNILLGNQTAASDYLHQKTFNQLESKFAPVINNSLDQVNATTYWNEIITRYNKIPLVEDVNPDLGSYVTARALDGLFLMVEKKEMEIRQNVGARSTNLLQKVFGYADSQQSE